ncbi:MAG: YceI family protein [Pseudomonadota bacterium]
MKRAFIAILAAAWSLPASAETSAWASAADRSSLTFAAVFDGVDFEGRFETFSVEVTADPEDAVTAGLDVRVTLASVNTENEERDTALLEAEWFDVARHPEARYVVKGLAPGVTRTWRANGELSLKGRTAQVPLEFDLGPADGGVRLVGSLVLAGTAVVDRLAFAVGEGEWADPELIGSEIQVSFDVVLVPR